MEKIRPSGNPVLRSAPDVTSAVADDLAVGAAGKLSRQPQARLVPERRVAGGLRGAFARGKEPTGHGDGGASVAGDAGEGDDVARACGPSATSGR